MMKLTFRRKVLLSIGVVAGIGSLAGAGTFASFTAQDKNPGNTFASGTLVLSDTAPTGTACLSTGAGVNTDTNVNDTCTTAYALSVRKPGDSATANITLQNVGTLPASALKLFSTTCTNSDAAAETYHGTGLPCAKVQVYVQKWTSSARTTAVSCLYGGATANVCDFTDATKTLAAFSTAYPSGATTLGAGTLTAVGTGDTAWITIGVKLPSDADNTFQGRTATNDFTWLIEQ
jgi:predicted ribosomally synthesized peptide with SipW-like signal peptide